MMKKKRILTLALVVAIVAVLITGATLAYFTDTDRAENKFTFGLLDIEVTETLAMRRSGAYTFATFGEWNASAWNTAQIEDATAASYIAGLGVPAMETGAAVPYRYRIDKNEYLNLSAGLLLDKDPRIDNRATSDAVVRMTIEITGAREWLVAFAKEYITDTTWLGNNPALATAINNFVPKTTDAAADGSLANAVDAIEAVADGWQSILTELNKIEHGLDELYKAYLTTSDWMYDGDADVSYLYVVDDNDTAETTDDIYKVQYTYYYLSAVPASADIDDYTKDTFTDNLFTQVYMPDFLERSFFDYEFDINMIGDGVDYASSVAGAWEATEAGAGNDAAKRTEKFNTIKAFFERADVAADIAALR